MVGGIASVRCAKHTTAKLRNVGPMWPPSKVATIAARCIDSARGGMVRAPTNGQMRADKKRNAQACAKYRMMRQKSTLATFRNISSAYHPHKLGLSVQVYYVAVGDWHNPSRCDYVSGSSNDCVTYRKRLPIRTRNRESWLIRIVIKGAGCYGCGTRSPADADTYQYQGRPGDWHKYKCTIVQAYYYAPMRVCAYNDMSI